MCQLNRTLCCWLLLLPQYKINMSYTPHSPEHDIYKGPKQIVAGWLGFELCMSARLDLEKSHVSLPVCPYSL